MSSTKKASTTAKPKTSSTRKTSSTKPASTKPASSTKRSSTTSKPSSTSRSSTPPVTSIPSTSSELPESTTSVFSEEPSLSSSEPFEVPPVFSSSPSLPSSSESPSTSLSSSFSQTPILPSSSETFQPSSSSSSSSSLDVGVGGISEPPEIKPIPVGAVAGGAVGGLVVGCLAVIGIVFCLRKRKAKRLSSRISTSDPKHPFFPMDTFAASTTEFTPVPYPVNAASPTRSDEQKVRLSAPRYSSPYVASQRGSTSPSSFQLESDPFATHTNVTSRIDMPYRDNSTPTQQTPPSSVTTSSEKEVGRRRLVVSGTGTSRSELPVLQHEDSGVRVTGREQGVIEVPPAYTPR